MNKKIIGLVVIIVIILGSIVYFTQNKSASTPPLTNQTDAQMASEADEFARAIESGQPTLCVLTKDSDSLQYQIKGKLMRVDSTSTSVDEETGNSITTTGHMINDGSYFYTWTDDETQGVKMAIPSEKDLKEMSDKAKEFENTSPSLASQEDYNSLASSGYTIDCKPGNFSDDIFTPPSSVKFIDSSSMMQEFSDATTGDSIDLEKIKELQEKYGSIEE